MSSNIYLYLLAITNIIFFLLGYLLSIKYKADNTHYDLFALNKTQRKQAEQNRIIEKVKSIDIDDRKVIINTDTSTLEKKFEILGEDTQVNESIESSINKLSQIMKGK
jgi:hypothetical protein